MDPVNEASFIVSAADCDRRSEEMGLGPMYYDINGNPIGLYEWAKLFENFDYKRVGFTVLPDGRHVSTVWMGLDHRFMPGGPPIIFESMLFGLPYETEIFGKMRTVRPDEDMDRYSTYYEAIWGHWAMVERHTLRLNP